MEAVKRTQTIKLFAAAYDVIPEKLVEGRFCIDQKSKTETPFEATLCYRNET
jgi:hypothetical protein